jgi:hypothetical protein
MERDMDMDMDMRYIVYRSAPESWLRHQSAYACHQTSP